MHTEVRFASFLSGGLIAAIVVNPRERKLEKHTFVQFVEINSEAAFLFLMLKCIFTRFFHQLMLCEFDS